MPRFTAGFCPVMTEAVVEKLKAVNINTKFDFMLRNPEELAKETSISYKDLQSIRRVIHAHQAAFLTSGTQLLQEAVHSSTIISTGCNSLDDLLGGGLMTGEVLELCGNSGTGKTTICTRLALHAAVNMGFQAIYVDPTASVTSTRLANSIEACMTEKEVTEEALSLVKVVCVASIWELFDVITNLNNAEIVKNNKVKVVIIDSLPFLFAPLFSNSNKQSLGIMNQLASLLKNIAVENQVAVVVVNSVVRDNMQSDNVESWKPGLGRYWAHVPNTRLFLQKGKQESPGDFMVTIFKSSRLRPGQKNITLFKP